MRLLQLLASVPFALHLACASATAAPPSREAPRVTAAAAGDVAALRAEGPAALERLLVRYDRMHAEVVRDQLAATIDKVAGQRYATVSRLYWYDDLAQAKAVARATGKPILSLRMLGRLDEDLSCANSRFFRTTLYPDAAVSKLLREKFVLHWSSERNVPKVTVDFGDGRKLESTVTGNSAHYVLDADGRPIDVLPGLYAPQVFVRELQVSLGLHAALRGLDGTARTEKLTKHHEAAARATSAQFAAIPPVPLIVGGRALMTRERVAGVAAAAQRATMSKAFVEVPMLKTVDVGVDPGTVPDDVELWAEIGQHMLKIGAPPSAEDAAPALNPWGIEAAPVQAKAKAAPAKAPAKARAARPVLDEAARHLVESMLAVPSGGTTLTPEARAEVIARLEQTIVADTALNEVRLRPMIRNHLIYSLQQGGGDFETVNEWVYTHVFNTPRSDAWMGLLPRDTFTGLPGGAVVES
jgi:hypothetical protein